MPSVRVPVQGTGIRHEGEGPAAGRGPGGAPLRSSAPAANAAQGARGGAPDGAAAGAQPSQGSEDYVPGRDLKASYSGRTPADSQTPQSAPAPTSNGIPAGMGFVFDKFGRAKLVSKEQAQAQAQEFGQRADEGADEGIDEGADFVDDASDSTGPPAGAGSRTAQGAATVDLPAIQSQISELSQAVSLLMQSQIAGKPLAEMMGRPAKPAAPTPPDPAQFDFVDPQSAAEYHRLNNAYMQAMIQQSVSEAFAPHREAMEGAKWQTQYNKLLADRGREPNFTAKAEAALKLVQKHPSKFSIPEAYDLVSDLVQQSPPQKQQGAQRKITPEQAQAKREASKKLPAGNGGVSGGGRAQLPSHITKLGAIMAFNRQFGRSQ